MNQAYSFKQKCERSELALRAFQRKIRRAEDAIPTTSRPVANIVSIESIADIKSRPANDDRIPAKQFSYLIQDQFADGSGKPTYQCMNCWITFDTVVDIETHVLDDFCTGTEAEKPLANDLNDDYDVDQSQDNNDSPMTDEEKVCSSANDVEEVTKSVPKLVCDNCNASFAMQHLLNVHRDSKKCVDQTLECDICKHVFTTKRNIRRHIHRMHRVERVRKNAKTANQEKKYKCTHCTKGIPQFEAGIIANLRFKFLSPIFVAFIMQSGLRDHLRTHR